MTDDVQNDSEGTFQWLLKHWKDDFLGKWYKHTHKSVKMCSLSSADPAIISLYTKLGNLILAFYKVWLFFICFWIHSFHTERMTGKKQMEVNSGEMCNSCLLFYCLISSRMKRCKFTTKARLHFFSSYNQIFLQMKCRREKNHR